MVAIGLIVGMEMATLLLVSAGDSQIFMCEVTVEEGKTKWLAIGGYVGRTYIDNVCECGPLVLAVRIIRYVFIENGCLGIWSICLEKS